MKQLPVAKAAKLGTLTGSSLWVVSGKASDLSVEDKSDTKSRGSRTLSSVPPALGWGAARRALSVVPRAALAPVWLCWRWEGALVPHFFKKMVVSC